MCSRHYGLIISISVRLGPAAESIVTTCRCHIRPAVLIYAFTRYGLERNRLRKSTLVNRIYSSGNLSFLVCASLLYASFVSIWLTSMSRSYSSYSDGRLVLGCLGGLSLRRCIHSC